MIAQNLWIIYLEKSIQPHMKLVKEGQMYFWVIYSTINGKNYSQMSFK